MGSVSHQDYVHIEPAGHAFVLHFLVENLGSDYTMFLSFKMVTVHLALKCVSYPDYRDMI